MIEHVLTGAGFALIKVDADDPKADARQGLWRLLIDPRPVPNEAGQFGIGISGELYTIILDDPAVAALHEQSAGATKIQIVPGLPAFSVPPREPG